MARHLKINDMLSEEDRASYAELLRHAGRPEPTIDELEDWLAEHGYKVSRGAVWNHKTNFEATLASVRQSAEMARAFAGVVKESGVAGLNDATIARLQQLQMEWAFAQTSGAELSPEDLERVAKSLNQLTAAAQRNEDLRTKFDEAMKAIQSKVQKKDGKISAGDIAEARKAIFGN